MAYHFDEPFFGAMSSHGFSTVSLSFPYAFPWFSHGFPMVSPMGPCPIQLIPAKVRQWSLRTASPCCPDPGVQILHQFQRLQLFQPASAKAASFHGVPTHRCETLGVQGLVNSSSFNVNRLNEIFEHNISMVVNNG